MNLGQHRFDIVDQANGIGARLFLDREHNRPLAIKPTGLAGIFHTVDHLGQLPQVNRGPFAVGHHQFAKGLGIHQEIIRFNRVVFFVGKNRAHRQIGIALAHSGSHFVDAQIAGGQQKGVELNPHSVFLRAKDIDLGHAIDHRDALGNHFVGKFIDLVKRQGLGGDR